MSKFVVLNNIIMKKVLLIIAVFLIGISNSFASHIPGGNISYQCTGNPNEYLITFTMFVSCPSTLGTTTNVQTNNNCGFPNPSISLTSPPGVEVSQICAAQQSQSDCPPGSGGIPGVLMYVYTGLVTLPGPCNSWTFYYDLCCRDASSNMQGTSGNSLYVQTTLNSVTAPCDGSPYVTAQPIPYVCAGQTQSYCPGAIDPDGDSLYYQLVSPLGAGGVTILHLPGYSPTAPLQNTVFDPITGCFTFNQSTIGNFVVTYLISAYDANGNLTGSIMHDFQFEVITCTNITPSPPAAGIVLTSGTATQQGPNTIELCEGSTACFSMTFSDVNAANILTIDTSTSNIFTVFPGASITTTGTNPLQIDICWTVPAGSPPQVIATVTVQDGACPIEGSATQVAVFNVVTSTVITPPVTTICGGQVANLSASGGSVFNWSIVPGGSPIAVGTNFTCNPCANPTASPATTTQYIVTSNLSGGCDNVDTALVIVVPDFTPTVTQSTPSACLFDPIQLNTTVVPMAPGYSYSWTPTAYLSATNIPNPIANITVPGSYTYTVTVTSPNGCVKTGSVTITIMPFVAPSVNILTPDSLMMCGDSIAVVLDLGGGIPAICGPSPTNTCSQPPTNTLVGTPTGSNTNTGWPAPYGNWYANAKHQFLYTAAELNAMGIMGGKITEIAWEVTAINGTTTYNSYQMKMGCTSTSSLTTWETGLTQVLNPTNVNVAIGMNVHVLDVAYEWDGISNLVIEICYVWSAQYSYTYNCITPWTTTAFNSSFYFYSDGTPACPELSGTSSTKRPVTRFTWCPTIPDPASFNYAWTPNVNILTSTMQNPTVYPSVPTSYIVTVTDTGGNCSDTDTLNVFVLCGACYQPAITITNPTCKDGTNGSIVINPTFTFGSEMQSFTWKDSLTGVVLQTTLNLTAGMQDSLTNIGAGAYTITMIDSSGCSQDTTIWLTEPDSVTIATITSNTTICIGGNIQISATAIDGNGGPYTYTWTNLNTGIVIPGNTPTVNPIDTLTCYSVFATDPLGCISSLDQVCITLFDSITATSLIASTTNDSLKICPTENQNIDIVASGGMGGPYTYTWYQNNIQIGTGSLITVTPTTPSSTYVGVADDNCSTPADSVIIYIDWYGLVIPSFTRNNPDSCYPFSVMFTNTSTPANLVDSIQWSITNGDSGSGNSINSTFDTPQCKDVTLTITTIDGCIVDTTSVNEVCPHDYPVANYSTNPAVTNILNTGIQFKNLSTGGVPPLTYLWNFNSGLVPDTSVVLHPFFTYPNNVPGTYNALLTVTDANGCQDDILGTIVVNGIYIFYMPNTFTPDGDGLNETFRPYGEGIDFSQYTMQIFDRWGEVIFETSNAERGWDGTYKGKKATAGTYIWKVVAKEQYAPIIHDNYGHVTIMR